MELIEAMRITVHHHNNLIFILPKSIQAISGTSSKFLAILVFNFIEKTLKFCSLITTKHQRSFLVQKFKPRK